VQIVANEYYEKYSHFSFYRNVEKDGVLIGWRI
jgi:hypothetical protein